jgi:protein TonB
LERALNRAVPIIAAALMTLAFQRACTVSARASGPQLKVFFAAEFKDTIYQQKTYKKVASSWRRPADTPKPGSRAVVIAVIQKDGSISEPVLHYKSGSGTWDAAALDAVRKAAPFDPLPKAYSRPSVEVHFHFESG